MIKVNEYLEGKVKSLGFELDGVAYTAGVLLPGDYSFSTEKEEHITVTVGACEIRFPEKDWMLLDAGKTAVVPPMIQFSFKVNKPASYVCMYT